MKQIQSRELLEAFKADTRKIILRLSYLRKEDPETLLHQPSPGKWSVAQVLEHLVSYGRYYLPLIQKEIQKNNYPYNPLFISGWLGAYFTKSMLPKENDQVKNKMKAPTNHRPTNDLDCKKVLDEFASQQQLLLELLEVAGQTDLNKITISISIAKWIKIRLGDSFGFIIAHHQRHFVQIENTLKMIKPSARLHSETF